MVCPMPDPDTIPNSSVSLHFTPHGILIAQVASEGASAWARKLAARFDEQDAAGLMALAAAPLPREADSVAMYWRDIAATFLHALCHVPESVELADDAVPVPTPGQLAEWTLNAPPMSGGEYIAPDALAALWRRLQEWTGARIAELGGVAAFLHAYAPHWTRVGRVSLHLAENKADPEFPFAFMATYAEGLSKGGRIRRLPLSRALNEYAGAGRKAELLKLLSPVHAASKRSELLADLVDTGDVFHPLAWTPDEAYAFLQEIPLYEECGLVAELPNWWKRRARPRVSVTLGASRDAKGAVGADAMLSFDVALVLGDEQLTEQELRDLLQATDPLVQLRGEWVEVDREKLQQALDHWRSVQQDAGADGVSFIEGMRLLAGAPADLKQDDAVADHAEWSMVCAGDALRQALDGLRTPSGLGGAQPEALRGELRHYQHDGLNWLWLCARLGVGSCLADDMGLGKTIQVLALLLRSREERQRETQPALLVVPASLIGNWKAEAERFAPDLVLWVAHTSESSRAALKAMAEDPATRLCGTDLVITTYSMVTRLVWLTEVPWHTLILDEAQAIKNPGTRQTRAIKKLQAGSRIALTGTPVENRLGDLWSIFDFLNPGLLGSAARFKSFAKALEQREKARYAPLRNLVAPYILRRMKTDPMIVPDLPDKTEMQIYCGLTRQQATLYQQCVKALAKALDSNGDGIQRRGLVLSYLMRFKQICNHPSQFSGDTVYTPQDSAKFARLTELCSEIASRGEKLLCFTQFREMTDPLAEHLATCFGRPGLILHGGTAVAKRKTLVAEFQREGGPPFFVLSIKAGGTGLNLTEASHVVHFDRWWNPAVENQATDRAFRIGQKRNVMVHKFVTRGTIEEKIDEMIRGKQQMADELLEGGGEKVLTEMSDDEIIRMVSLDIERTQIG